MYLLIPSGRVSALELIINTKSTPFSAESFPISAVNSAISSFVRFSTILLDRQYKSVQYRYPEKVFRK